MSNMLLLNLFSVTFISATFLTSILINLTQACDNTQFLQAAADLYSGINTTPTTAYLYDLLQWKDTYKIEVTNQNITILCYNSFKRLKRLNQISLTNNGIKDVQQGAFLNLSTLRWLNLSRNFMESVEDGVFNKLDLFYLSLDHNKISLIEGRAFDNMTNLRLLDLSSNKLRHINKEWFKNCDKLSTLNLENNEIMVIPEMAFANLVGRKIYPNGLETVLDISLARNKIAFVDVKAFQGLEGMGELNLEHNSIREVDEKLFSHFKFMRFFNLGFNKIECLPNNLDGVLVASEDIFLDGNPWNCDCLRKVETFSQSKRVVAYIAASRQECRRYSED